MAGGGAAPVGPRSAPAPAHRTVAAGGDAPGRPRPPAADPTPPDRATISHGGARAGVRAPEGAGAYLPDNNPQKIDVEIRYWTEQLTGRPRALHVQSSEGEGVAELVHNNTRPDGKIQITRNFLEKLLGHDITEAAADSLFGNQDGHLDQNDSVTPEELRDRLEDAVYFFSMTRKDFYRFADADRVVFYPMADIARFVEGLDPSILQNDTNREIRERARQLAWTRTHPGSQSVDEHDPAFKAEYHKLVAQALIAEFAQYLKNYDIESDFEHVNLRRAAVVQAFTDGFTDFVRSRDLGRLQANLGHLRALSQAPVARAATH